MENHEAQFLKYSVFIGQKSVFRHYCNQNIKDGIQTQVYNIINESVNLSSQFISVKVKKNLRKSQAQFREKLRKLRLRQNNDFLIKKTCICFVIMVMKNRKTFHFQHSMVHDNRLCVKVKGVSNFDILTTKNSSQSYDYQDKFYQLLHFK